MFKFKGLESLSDVQIIYFVICLYRNKTIFGFYVNSLTSEQFKIPRSFFVKFHREAFKKGILLEDQIFCYDEDF